MAGLRLDTAGWQPVRVQTVPREARGPDGAEATLTDNVIWMRRLPGLADGAGVV